MADCGKTQMTHEDEEPLTCSGDNDYVLREEHISCWVTVGNISVYIIRTDEGVIVELYPLGVEDSSTIASTYAFNHEAQAIIDELQKESNRTSKDNPSSD